ncbi:MAG: hypothetical protein LH654_07640 [Thermoleophilia bacterium]|nr:hypothetical protein [Thermoleophilia bacterium]
MIRTRGGIIAFADNVVVATPTRVSARLLELGPVKEPVSAHLFLVRGALRRPWASAMISISPKGDPILAVANVCDLEDAYLTGLCAAGRIIAGVR